MRVGYPCIALGEPEARCQRTTVLRNATPERLRTLISENIDGLQRILEYNEAHDYRMFRIGNAFVPFASHPVNQLAWWDEFGWWFRTVGRWVKQHGHRLSFHASHFTILNSENQDVVAASQADIEYMGRVLEAMDLGPEHKIILHLGVASPTHAEAEGRFERAFESIPEAFRRHLVVENDDRCYDAARAVSASRRLGVPVVLDVFHHQCLPGVWADLSCDELLRRSFETWRPDDGPPKIHFSSQDPEKRVGAHGYWIDGGELERFFEQTCAVPDDFDIMFECKGKDLAVAEIMSIVRAQPRFHLRQADRVTV